MAIRGMQVKFCWVIHCESRHPKEWKQSKFFRKYIVELPQTVYLYIGSIKPASSILHKSILYAPSSNNFWNMTPCRSARSSLCFKRSQCHQLQSLCTAWRVHTPEEPKPHRHGCNNLRSYNI